MKKMMMFSLLIAALTLSASVTPTMICMNAMCYVYVNGAPALPGTVVKFVADNGSVYGEGTLKHAGAILLPVYGADPVGNKGAAAGDKLKAFIDGTDTGVVLEYVGEFKMQEIIFGLGDKDITAPYVVKQEVSENQISIEFSEPVLLKKEQIVSESAVKEVKFSEEKNAYVVEFEKLLPGTVKISTTDLFGNAVDFIAQ